MPQCNQCQIARVRGETGWKHPDVGCYRAWYCPPCYQAYNADKKATCGRCGEPSGDADMDYCEQCDQQLLDDEYAEYEQMRLKELAEQAELKKRSDAWAQTEEGKAIIAKRNADHEAWLATRK